MSDFTTFVRRKIGQQLIFPDGIGTNYSQNVAPRTSSAPILTPNSISSSSDIQFQSSCFSKAASEPCSSILPPRHRRPRKWQHYDNNNHENMIVEGDSVFLHNLLPKVNSNDLALFFRDIGFTAPVKIIFIAESSVRLEFSHSNVAAMAFSLIQYRATCLFAEPFTTEPKRTTSLTLKKEVIDLTKIDDAPNFFVERSDGRFSLQKSCTGDLTEDTNDDSMPESSDSEISVRSAAKETRLSDTRLSQNHSENASINAHLTKTFELPRDELNANTATDTPARPHGGRGQSSAPTGEAQQAVSPVLSSTIDPVTDMRTDGSYVQVVKLPPAAHNRARRVLLPHNQELPIMTISMKADVQFFDCAERHRISRYSIPNNATGHRHTANAVMVGDTAVIGYRNSACQVSLVRNSKGGSPVLTELEDKPHLEQNTPGTTKNGVNCLAARKSTKNTIHFFTGGYDRTIRLWSVTTPDLETKTERLTTLPTIPNALAYKDRILLVGTSKKILTLDLDHLSAKPITAQLDHSINQIHVHKQAPNVTILEMDSLDFQIQIFDDRKKRGFDRSSDCSFGTRCGESMSARSSSRGDSHLCMFAKGFADGTVRLWDYRHTKRPMLTKVYQNMGAIAHTVFTESGNVICYNTGNLIFVDSRT